MSFGILALYILTLVSFLPPIIMAATLWSRGRAPLAANFVKFQLTYLGFLTALFAAFVSLTAFPQAELPIEVLFNTLFFLLYAALATTATRFLNELLQRPWVGNLRRLSGGFALLGIAAVVVIHAVVYEGHERVLALRYALNGGYFMLFLVGLVLLFGLVWFRAPQLADPWKRSTARGSALIFFLAVPLFVVDALWPWLQGPDRLPRGLNLQMLPLLIWNLYFTWRWLRFPLDEPAAAHEGELSSALMDLLTAREREIALLLVAGKSNQEVCESLGVRMGTTKNHIYNIFNKTGASSRQEFARMLRG